MSPRKPNSTCVIASPRTIESRTDTAHGVSRVAGRGRFRAALGHVVDTVSSLALIAFGGWFAIAVILKLWYWSLLLYGKWLVT
jgi:hypothetical protein